MRTSVVILLILMAGCQADGAATKASEDITLTASDGTHIQASYYPGGEKGVVLMHMLGRDRQDWDPFARGLMDRGYTVLAIDLRGHGGSDLDVTNFGPDDFNAMVYDAGAAVDHLEAQGVKDLALIGASIGANTALRYAVQDHDVRCTVLLSPGLDYRGVKTPGEAASYGGRPILIVASTEDTYSASSAMALYEEAAEPKRIEMYQGAGHGTQMFSDPRLEPLLLGWLRDECFIQENLYP